MKEPYGRDYICARVGKSSGIGKLFTKLYSRRSADRYRSAGYLQQIRSLSADTLVENVEIIIDAVKKVGVYNNLSVTTKLAGTVNNG